MSLLSFAAGGLGTAYCLSRWGSTPGKWLFGIKVFGEDGTFLSQRQAYIRELNLYWWGVGFGVTVLAWIMLVRSFVELRVKHRTCWDTKVGATVHGRALDGRMYAQLAIGFLLVIAIKGAETHMIFSDELTRIGAAAER